MSKNLIAFSTEATRLKMSQLDIMLVSFYDYTIALSIWPPNIAFTQQP